MPPSLPSTGTCTYNGFTFSNNVVTTDLSITPVYDTAGRTVVYSIFALTLEDKYTNSGASIETLMETVRSQLLSPAGELVYANKGLGDLTINSGTKKDVLWGPKPKSFRWKPLGDNKAAKIIWSVDVAIPACTNAVYTGALMEVNYKARFAIDRSGYTTRTYSGYLRIPQTRSSQSSRTLQDSADAYRDRIVPAIVDNFRRTQEYTLDESKCRLDFSITDEELPPNPLPEGVIDCQASHTVSTSGASLVKWRGTLRAQYEMRKDLPRTDAVKHFLALCKQRLALTKQFATGDQNSQLVIPTGLTFTEPEIYGRNAALLELGYTYATSIGNCIKASALWTPVNGTFSQWRQSMGNVMNERGLAQLKFSPSEDAIIDLCQSTTPASPGQNDANQPDATAGLLAGLGLTPPPPDKSWLHYECKLSILTDDRVVEHKPLTTTQPQVSTDGQAEEPLNTAGTFLTIEDPGSGIPSPPSKSVAKSKTGGGKVGYNATTPNKQQRAGNPSFVCYLIGKAMRAGFEIPVPTLTDVGGIVPTPANRSKHGEGFSQWQYGYVGVPIIVATWRLRFLLPQAPTGPIGSVANPTQPT